MKGRPEKMTTPRRGGWTYVLETDKVARPPKLPAGVKFAAATRTYWKAIWASPFATLYSESDVAVLERLMSLHTAFLAKPMASTSAEMRRLEDGLGLSPASRGRLRWAMLKHEANGHKPEGMLELTRAARREDDPREALGSN